MYGTHRLEMVQRSAARYVTNRYHNPSSVSSMIEQLEWTTLQERRKHSRLLMMYKLKNNIVRVDASSKLIPNERPSRNKNEQTLHIPSCKTTAHKDSFYPRTIKEWNTLPNCTVCPESWILQGSAPSLNLNDTVFMGIGRFGHSTSSATLYKDVSAMVLFMLFYVLFITILCINNHIEYKKK